MKSVKDKLRFVTMLSACVVGTLGLRADGAGMESKLWYDKPATNCETEALPIGNGRLGAMIFGGVEREQIQFNESSLWIGVENDTGAYQAFGDVFVELDGQTNAITTNYRRELDINRAGHTVSYTQNGVNYRREYFASHPANVIVLRFTADKPGAYSGSVLHTDMHKGTISADENRLVSSGSLAGYKFEEKSPDYSIALDYEAQVLDKPTAGLLINLKERGLLENTLVVWCTEFGRMPTFQKIAQGRVSISAPATKFIPFTNKPSRCA